MFVAVPLPEAGDWEVALDYAPDTPAVPLEAAGLALTTIALCVAFLPRRHRDGNAASSGDAA